MERLLVELHYEITIVDSPVIDSAYCFYDVFGRT